ALVSQTIQEHAAIGSIKREKVRAAKQIRALRVLLLERFRILPEETRREFFAVQVEAGHQEESFGSFLLEDHIAVAIPGCCQGLGPIVVERSEEHTSELQ